MLIMLYVANVLWLYLLTRFEVKLNGHDLQVEFEFG